MATAEATYMIYSTTSDQAKPIGFVVGEIYRTEHMLAINPLLNNIELRMLKATDEGHKHIEELSKTDSYLTLGMDTRFDVGAIMGFSGFQCYHFTMKTMIILYVRAKVISLGIERLVESGKQHLLLKGDVRILVDESIAQIYILRGEVLGGTKLLGTNRERNFNLNLVEAFKLAPSVFSNQPIADSSKTLVDSGKALMERTQSLIEMTANLCYLGMIKKTDEGKDVDVPIAIICGNTHPAVPEPYRFAKGASDFIIKFIGKLLPELSRAIDSNQNLLTITVAKQGSISVHSLSGNGLKVAGETTVKLCGHLLVVDERDGSLLSKTVGCHSIKITTGHVKFYVCDVDIILLDHKTDKYQIDK